MDVPESAESQDVPNKSVVARSSSVPKRPIDYSLQMCRFYPKGFDLALSQHCMESVTTYGVRKSRKKAGEDKETKLRLVTIIVLLIPQELPSGGSYCSVL